MTKSLTTGTPWRRIALFSVPLLIGNVVQQLYHFADAIVVGRQLGVTALGAVGATTALLFLVLGFALGLASGFAIPVAQAFGAGDYAAVRRGVAIGSVLTLFIGVVFSVAGYILAEPALRLLQTPEALMPDATVFARISFLGSAVVMAFNYLAAIIRAVGDSRTPLIFLIISCVLNIGLVVLFVGPLGMGVAGAALATILAQATATALCLEYVRRRLSVLHVRRGDWRPRRAEAADQLRMGLPMAFQFSIISLGSIAVQVRVNELGPDAVAAFTTAARVDMLSIALLNSLGLAVSMFAAQNFSGAGHFDRVRQGVRQALWLALGASLLLGAAVFFGGRPIAALFLEEHAETVIELIVQYLMVTSLTYSILGVLFVLRGALQGLGWALIPALTGVAELAMRLLTAVYLGDIWGYAGVVWGTPLAWAGAAVLLIPAYAVAARRLRSSKNTEVRQASSDRVGVE